MERPHTYGGESELLLVRKDNGHLMHMSKDMQHDAQQMVDDNLDMRRVPVDVGGIS